MIKIFISYRRTNDANAAHRLADDLRSEVLGEEIFFDRQEHSIRPGDVFPDTIREAANQCRIMIAVIGRGWPIELLQDPADWVRQELAIGLGRPDCRVIPLIVDSDVSKPRATSLPDELEALALAQDYELLPDRHRADALTRLKAEIRRVFDEDREDHDAFQRLVATTRTEAAPEVVGLHHEAGAAWSPEQDDPHAYDFKYVVTDAERQVHLRTIVADAARGRAVPPMAFELLSKLGTRRKYQDSPSKKGMFLQAAALVTRGGEPQAPEHVLVNFRGDFQFHARENSSRNVKGPSCLIGTVLDSFETIDDHGHVPTALFRTLNEPNPWALFGRKLLLPAAVARCRFLGLGFNFTNADKQYLMFTWHVHCEDMHDTPVLVPARSTSEANDFVEWIPCDEVDDLPWDEALIDRAVLDLKGWRRETAPSPNAGFVAGFPLGQTRNHAGHATHYARHAAEDRILSLLQRFQHDIHRGHRQALVGHAVGIAADLERYLRERLVAGHIDPTTFRTTDEEGENELLIIEHHDSAERRTRRYAVRVTSGPGDAAGQHAVDQLKQAIATGFRSYRRLLRDSFQGLFVLHLAEDGDPKSVQNPIYVHGAVPTYVVRVAVGKQSRHPTRRVAHAVIPILGVTGSADRIVWTHKQGDPTGRLPGGKIRVGEPRRFALRRELREELGLGPEHIAELQPVLAGGSGWESVEPCPDRSEDRHYFLHPFLVQLTPEGVEQLRDRMQANDSLAVSVESLDAWRETGLGYDASYARAVLSVVPPETLTRFACRLG